MKYLGTILALCFIIFALFGMYKYTPDMVKGAKFLAVGIFNVLESTAR